MGSVSYAPRTTSRCGGPVTDHGSGLLRLVAGRWRAGVRAALLPSVLPPPFPAQDLGSGGSRVPEVYIPSASQHPPAAAPPTPSVASCEHLGLCRPPFPLPSLPLPPLSIPRR